MRTKLFQVILMSSLLAITGCAGYQQQPAAQNVDWNQAPSIQITLSLRRFDPGKVILHRGSPVRLVFRNGTGTTHDFVTALFQNVSQSTYVDQGGTRVILQPEDQVTYYVVPRTIGKYSVATIMFVTPGYIPSAIVVIK